MIDRVEKVARAIAQENGDNFDNIPAHKPHWTRERGQFGGRYRDINEPFQSCYLSMAEAAIKAYEGTE